MWHLVLVLLSLIIFAVSQRSEFVVMTAHQHMQELLSVRPADLHDLWLLCLGFGSALVLLLALMLQAGSRKQLRRSQRQPFSSLFKSKVCPGMSKSVPNFCTGIMEVKTLFSNISFPAYTWCQEAGGDGQITKRRRDGGEGAADSHGDSSMTVMGGVGQSLSTPT